MTSRIMSLLPAAVVSTLVACSASPTATPDLVATEVAVQKAAIATLTAEAPTATRPVSTPPSPAPAPIQEFRGVRIGTPSDDVLQLWGKGTTVRQLGTDSQGLVVEWVYPEVTLVMKLREVGGVTRYRVAEIHPRTTAAASKPTPTRPRATATRTQRPPSPTTAAPGLTTTAIPPIPTSAPPSPTPITIIPTPTPGFMPAGSPITVNNWEVRVERILTADSITWQAVGDTTYATGRWALLFLAVTNRGSVPETFYVWDQLEIQDAEGARYAWDSHVTLVAMDDYDLCCGLDIAPGATDHAVAGYDISRQSGWYALIPGPGAGSHTASVLLEVP